MAFCSQYGTRTIAGDRFCRQCGAALDDPVSPAGPHPPAAAPPAPAWSSGSTDLLQFAVDYPPRLSRLLIFVKWLLAVPHCLALFAYALVFGAVTFVAWLAILFTGRFPQRLFHFVEGALRWNYRAQAYVLLLTDRYPPFSTAVAPDAGRPQYAAP